VEDFSFTAELWQWDAQTTSSWFFVSLPVELADDLRMEAGPPRGFGSIRVEAVIGSSVWQTSVFPSDGTFVLPVKKPVRVREGIEPGDTVEVSIRPIED
jgi:hypothetical protein